MKDTRTLHAMDFLRTVLLLLIIIHAGKNINFKAITYFGNCKWSNVQMCNF